MQGASCLLHPVNRIALTCLLLAGLSAGATAARAQENDMFPTKALAERRAMELGCSGAFAMGAEWMPCQNFSAYQKSVSRKK